MDAQTIANLNGAIHRVAQDFSNILTVYETPHVKMRPRLMLDGELWCALYGENLQDGVAGFGRSPELAMLDFDKAWCRLL